MVELVNDHVLFPELANWSDPPAWQRLWQNQVSSAVTGAESRAGLRSQPRSTLTFLITPGNLPEQSLFDDRIRAAKKSGKACAPYAGRGYVLQGDVDADTAELDRSWNVFLGDSIFFLTAAGLYEVRTVVDVDGNEVTLDQAVTRTYRGNAFAWPLIFGKFATDSEMPASMPRLGEMKLSIAELVSAASAQIGEIEPPADDGIGVWSVGTTFSIQ